ncbi:unnamed protein product, partial [Durusdinium trenchii]
MIATLALMAMLPSLTVNAVRESTGKFLQDHRDHSERLFTKCRSAKCSSQSFELSGDGGRLLFEECQVKENQPLETASGETMCQETCTVRDSKDQPRTVTVWHKSGHGLQVCQLQVGYDFCEDTCCRSKCSGQSYELKTEWKGQWQFQDCELKGSFGSGYRTLCAEKCTVVHTKESQQVLVLRESGPEPQCELQKVGFPEMAIQFVEQLEHDALKITDGEYWRLPLMEAKKIKFFLSKVKEDVLMPEFQAAEGHGASREISTEVKHVAIIGDLHGQLFNLIAHLIRIKETYKDKGFIPLDGSSLLFCDPRMQYIFLGDYVDRGERGIELLLLLLAYKARCPQGLILLNGNHEDPSVFESYGFLEELQTKFDDNPITQQVIDVLQILPYVAVVPGNFMAMHGGITPAFVKACTGKAGRFG